MTFMKLDLEWIVKGTFTNSSTHLAPGMLALSVHSTQCTRDKERPGINRMIPPVLHDNHLFN